MKTTFILTLLIATLLWPNSGWADKASGMKLPLVSAQTKPGQAWKEYPTRTIHHLPGFRPATMETATSKYGGLLARKVEATGFFYPKKIDGRWWLVDPEGYLFIHEAVVSLTPGPSANSRAALKEKFGTDEKWADYTTNMLKQHGFNGTGAWSNTNLIRKSATPLVYTLIWNFMSSYGKKRGGTYQQPGHTGYPNDCIFVFDPEFETFCDTHARQLSATKDDPYLLGHFSDNELPFPRDALDKYMSLKEEDWGYKAAKAWLKEWKGRDAGKADITADDRWRFRKYVSERYFSIVSEAIKKYDPNHLFIGSRLHGGALSSPAVFEAAGSYVDVVSVNYYGAWTPDQKRMSDWAKWSGKPFLVTEWYVKGADSGMANTGGAGWIVKTQKDRGLFYQNFALGLLESKLCVGWHWFKYMDNDPANLAADPSNRDSNKGVVTIRYEEYRPLLDAMMELNSQTYSLIDYFDQKEN